MEIRRDAFEMPATKELQILSPQHWNSPPKDLNKKQVLSSHSSNCFAKDESQGHIPSTKNDHKKSLKSPKVKERKIGRSGRPLKDVTFPDDDKDLVRVHHVQTYKRWNYRAYIYVCSHLSYFDRSDLEGIEDEIDERFDIDDHNEQDNSRISLFEEADQVYDCISSGAPHHRNQPFRCNQDESMEVSQDQMNYEYDAVHRDGHY